MWHTTTFILIVEVFLFIGNNADKHFLEPKLISDIEEAYFRGNLEYRLVKDRSTWHEAQILCEEKIKSGSLAIANSSEIQEFFAQILGETDFEIEQAWIGAQKTGLNFYWVDNQIFDFVEYKRMINRTHDDTGTLRNVTRNCIVFERKNHDIPHLIDMDCSLSRPYICQRLNLHNETTRIPWIHTLNAEYVIVRQSLSWNQAVAYCKEILKAQIATFRDVKEIAAVAHYMLIGRPSLETAWIGGFFDAETKNWKFLPTGVTIPEQTNKFTKFPPWHRNHKSSGCMMLDRHLHDINDFGASQCKKLKAFVCERDSPAAIKELFVRDGIRYYTGLGNVTWEQGQKNCANLGNGTLAKITKPVLKDLLYYMGERQLEIKHIWIGGRYDEEKNLFKWVKDNSTVPPNSDGDKYPPWYDNFHGVEEECLNLDRENHNVPIFYGTNCGAYQSYICEQ